MRANERVFELRQLTLVAACISNRRRSQQRESIECQRQHRLLLLQSHAAVIVGEAKTCRLQRVCVGDGATEGRQTRPLLLLWRESRRRVELRLVHLHLQHGQRGVRGQLLRLVRL